MTPKTERREPAADRVLREDAVTFINACFSCTGQREHYGDATGQSVSIRFLHEYVLGNYRSIYARALAAGINDFNAALILRNLLATPGQCAAADYEEEKALVWAALRRLPPPRVYRIFDALTDARVNNRRTRAIIRDYVASRPDPNFDAIKYRGRFRASARHAHLRLASETGRFLFESSSVRKYDTPLLEAYRRAHYERRAIYELPFTIAEGFAARAGIPRDEFLAGIDGKLTRLERLRLQESARREGVKVDVDLARAAPTRLASYILSLCPGERLARRDELHHALTSAAARVAAQRTFPTLRIAAVLDASRSARGTRERRLRPLAVALASSYLLRAASASFAAFWTRECEHELDVEARGQTDLATPLLSALAWRPDLVVLISDGYENDPPGAVSEIVRVFRAKLDPGGKTSIVHASPVFDAEHYGPRQVATSVPTVGLRTAEDLLTMLAFARFAEGAARVSELSRYLQSCVATFLAAPAERS